MMTIMCTHTILYMTVPFSTTQSYMYIIQTQSANNINVEQLSVYIAAIPPHGQNKIFIFIVNQQLVFLYTVSLKYQVDQTFHSM